MTASTLPGRKAALVAAITCTVALLAPLGAAAAGGSAAHRWVQRGSFHPLIESLAGVACPTTRLCLAVGSSSSASSSLPGLGLLSQSGGGVTAAESISFGGGFGGGVVLRSTDGGNRWRPEPVPSGTGPLSSVACPSAEVCFATESALLFGGGAGVIRTTDAGRTWLPQLSTEDDFGLGFTSIECGSVDDCIVAGSSFGGAEAWRTTNGGGAWISVSPFESYDSASLTGGACTSPDDCEIAGTAILKHGSAAIAARTIDGGITWTPQTFPAGTSQVTSLSCTSATVCEILGAHGGRLEALGTIDGGTTWTAQQLPAGVTPTSIACSSANDCVVVGSTVEGGHRRGAMLSTSDGGASWTVRAAPDGDRMIDSASCSSASRCVMVGEATSTWPQILRLAPGVFAASSLPAAHGVQSILSFACASAERCVALGIAVRPPATRSMGLFTRDDGRHWLATSSLPSGLVSGDVACPSASFCMMAGTTSQDHGVIAVSDNAGATWRVAHRTKQAVFTVTCSSASSCLAGGYLTMIRTTDGGASWSNVRPKGAGWIMTSLACPTGSTCVAVAATLSGRTIFAQSLDGGKSWTKVAEYRRYEIADLSGLALCGGRC